jgi:CRP/FNR family transcriptional regulator
MQAEALARTAPIARPAATLRPPAKPDFAADGARWRESLALIERCTAFTRRIVHAGENVYAGGEAFAQLHLINTGVFKTVNNAADGRGQLVGLHFRGDWLGFDGIASGRQTCDAVAVDTGEVWTVRYADLIAACIETPALMQALHAAMSAQIARDCDALLAMGTLPADARVANFLKNWAQSLEARGQRTDQITLHLSRAEIGNFLGMTLETVSRVLARLARSGVIRFDERDRRAIAIPSLAGLEQVVHLAGAADERKLH